MLSQSKRDGMMMRDGGEQYQEVFKVLDQLGWADLKATFQEHCIEDQTLNFMETEEELKSLLKEIGIPLGKCIPIVKSWSRKNAKRDAPDLTKGVELSSLGSGQHQVSKVHMGVQAVTATSDATTQTEDMAGDHPSEAAANISAILEELVRVRQESQEASVSGYEAGMPLNNPTYTCNMTSQAAELNMAQPVPMIGDMFNAGQMQAFSTHGWPFLNNTDMSGMGFSHAAQYHNTVTTGAAAIPDMTATSSGVTPFEGLGMGHTLSDVTVVSSGVTPLGLIGHTASDVSSGMSEFEGHGAIGDILPPSKSSPHKEIVDEREDLAIEQSLFEEMEKEHSHSYASALHTRPTKRIDKESVGSAYQSNGASTIQSKIPASKLHSAEKISQFSKVDDIVIQSGTLKKSTSCQNIGSQTLQAYLDSVPESQEYRDAVTRYGVKKGWKPIDGKHIYSGKKIQFKPICCDKELRMRHGVPVRGADKSEECFRHTAGKAPASCTFAHSRLGDTLQFICVKCTCEKTRHDWCMDKAKHKQFIFNMGHYRNIDGEVWKAVST